MKYDYLIVGAGLFGAVFAQRMTEAGKRCLVIDKRAHIGGNVYTGNIGGIDVHTYGAHIFHTSDEEVWAYVNRFARFNGFINSPVAVYGGARYPLPFNMNTFCALWADVKTPEDAKAKIAAQTMGYTPKSAKNLEEKAISLVGYEIFEKLIKGYTEKQWGRDCRDLPAFIIERIPLRFTFDNNYFNDKYQGIPVGGYTPLIEKLLDGCAVLLGTSYSDFTAKHGCAADRIVYTGAIDEYFGCRLGALEYRTLRFETEKIDVPDFQGSAVVNYTERGVPYTRIIEHKHFEGGDQPFTVVTREYPEVYREGMEKYYPVNDEKNNALYARYRELAKKERNIVFAGRLGSYGYFDMDKTVRCALDLAASESMQKQTPDPN